MENYKFIFFDNDIFLNQKYGGIRTYFTNLILNLNNLDTNFKIKNSSLKYIDLLPKHYFGIKYLSKDNIDLFFSFLKPIQFIFFSK